jgi:hypothetical protein
MTHYKIMITNLDMEINILEACLKELKVIYPIKIKIKILCSQFQKLS